jgi:peptidoglycan/LPS O-acetylase OafA/YrhL
MGFLSHRAAGAGHQYRDLDYRPDIDGLRAVAIVPVLAFHAGLPGWSGGFVGVDVFFVISGFLITSLILAEHARGTFSFWGFMERRARRLVPATVPVLAATLLAGWFLFLPNDFQELAKSVMMLCGLAANHYFLSESGYFDFHGPAPLLHTWSLSVEEQFYLAFSVTLLAILTWMPRRLEVVIAVAALLSFATATALIETGRENAAFYLSLSRFWELLIGAWLALGRMPEPGPLAARCCRALGLLLIAGAVFLYDSATPFPGVAALAPTLGAALVIFAGTGPSDDPAYRLLASRGAVYVGRISYSLYLWHWPLLLFAGLYAEILPSWYRLPVAAFALIPATLSYHFVERPFRKRIWLPQRAQMLGATVLFAALLVAVGHWIDHGKGLPFRLPADVQLALQEDPLLTDPQVASCTTFTELGKACALGNLLRPRIDFAVWGDSHAAADRPVFDRLAAEQGLHGVLFTHPGCAADMSYFYPRPDARCDQFNRDVEAFIAKNDIPTVFLVARWCLYADASLCLDPVPIDGRHDGRLPDQTAKRASFPGMLAGLVDRLKMAARTVWLMQPVPEFRTDVRTMTAEALLRGLPTDGFVLPREKYLAANDYIFGILRELDDGKRVREISVLEILCPGATCLATDPNGLPYYRDANHLSARGAQLLAPHLAPAFQEMQENAAVAAAR